MEKVLVKPTNQMGFISYKRIELGDIIFFIIDNLGNKIYNGNMSGFNSDQLIFL